MPACYTIRESPRARYIRLKVTLEGELVVVVPHGASRRSRAGIPDLVRREAAWIDRARASMLARRQRLPDPASLSLPYLISFRAIEQRWAVRYAAGNGRARPGLREKEGNELEVIWSGGRDAAAAALRRWTGRQARHHLVPWLEAVASRMGFEFQQAAIRSQRTRWGSCSPRGTISLNQKLIFLPAHLTRYVLVHELCHTVHLNHSKCFWRLLERRQPGSRELDRELRGAWRYVPWWMCDIGSGELNESHCLSQSAEAQYQGKDETAASTAAGSDATPGRRLPPDHTYVTEPLFDVP